MRPPRDVQIWQSLRFLLWGVRCKGACMSCATAKGQWSCAQGLPAAFSASGAAPLHRPKGIRTNFLGAYAAHEAQQAQHASVCEACFCALAAHITTFVQARHSVRNALVTNFVGAHAAHGAHQVQAGLSMLQYEKQGLLCGPGQHT